MTFHTDKPMPREFEPDPQPEPDAAHFVAQGIKLLKLVGGYHAGTPAASAALEMAFDKFRKALAILSAGKLVNPIMPKTEYTIDDDEAMANAVLAAAETARQRDELRVAAKVALVELDHANCRDNPSHTYCLKCAAQKRLRFAIANAANSQPKENRVRKS